MRVLIAGGTGVLGRAVVPRLVAAGHEVLAVSRREGADARLQAAGATPLRLDVFDAAAVTAAAHECEAVVNIATHIPSTTRAGLPGAWDTNDRLRRDASRVLGAAAISSGARFVQESFAPAYADNGAGWITEEHPLDPVAQAATVVDAETSAAAVTRAGGTGVVLRFGLFYGADSAQTRQLLAAARKGLFAYPGRAEAYGSWIYVDDAAAAVVAALVVPAGVYNVVEDEPLTRADHAGVLGTLLGRPSLRLLPVAAGQVKVLRALARSHRVSNAKLRDASQWRPVAPSVLQGWRLILAEVARDAA